ncbi:MAG: GTPase HflX [Chloroflexota bacterium]
MAKRSPKSTTPPKERAFLVGVEIHNQVTILSLDDSLTELELLADTAGLTVVGSVTQKLDRPNPKTYIGTGKVEELKALAEEAMADVVLFDDELSPRHQRELDEAMGANLRVLDRTAVILDIFAQHAHTSDGQLQVKLAQYEYNFPRLAGQWAHLARQAGGGAGRTGSAGGVGLRGPGETQLETDRRAIRREISNLKDELEKVRAHRMRYRSQRKRSRIPTVALVGYTNAGKSTLLNRVAKSDVYVADRLFATLDPTTRRVELPGGYIALFTDTVGFIQKLPTTLFAAFRATLEEIADAELILHVVDLSHPNALNQVEAVHITLKEIGASHIPVITALNKVDRLPDPQAASHAVEQFPQAIAISAMTGHGIPELLDTIRLNLFERFIPIFVRIPYKEARLIALFHEHGQLDRIVHRRKDVEIQGKVPGRLAAQFNVWKANLEDLDKETSNHEIAEPPD